MITLTTGLLVHVIEFDKFRRRLFGIDSTVTMATAPYATCAERLAKAKAAFDRMLKGENVQVVTHDGRTITYFPGQRAALRRYIRELELECGETKRSGGEGRARVIRWCR